LYYGIVDASNNTTSGVVPYTNSASKFPSLVTRYTPREGLLYLVWESNKDIYYQKGECYYDYQTVSWFDYSSLPKPSNISKRYTPSIAIDNGNNLVVAWKGVTDMPIISKIVPSEYHYVFYQRKTDSQWSNPTAVLHNDHEGELPSVSAYNTDEIDLVFRCRTSDKHSVFGHFDGTRWTFNVISGATSYYPNVLSSSDGAYAVWAEGNSSPGSGCKRIFGRGFLYQG
jgi:hypothetical protein